MCLRLRERGPGCQNDDMPTQDVIAQATDGTNPILPATNETLWGAISVIAPLIVVIMLVVLVAKYFQRLRRAAEDAAKRAGATERELAGLRQELREKSA